MNVAKRTLHNDIFSVLRDRIVHMEYPPGMALNEKDLCEEFKVSRTPLREAIRKLEDNKLVTAIPRYGTYVAQIDINEIRSAYEVKMKLEGLAGSLAARRINPAQLKELRALVGGDEDGDDHDLVELDARFHAIVYEAAQNPILEEFCDNLHARSARLWVSSLSAVIPLSEVRGQLRDIYRALENRDAAEASRLMEAHVQYFIETIKTRLL